MNAVERDAREFGRHTTQGEWRLALLVARCVERVRPGRQATGTYGKVSAVDFGRLAFPSNAQTGTSAAGRIVRYLDAWDRAAADGHVPAAAELRPGREIDIDLEKLEQQGVYWSHYYTSENGGYDWAAGHVVPAAEMKTTSGRRAQAFAKGYLDVAEAANSKREAYKNAAEALSTLKEKTGWSWGQIAKRLDRPESTLRTLDRWRHEGYTGANPFTAGTRKKVAS